MVVVVQVRPVVDAVLCTSYEVILATACPLCFGKNEIYSSEEVLDAILLRSPQQTQKCQQS